MTLGCLNPETYHLSAQEREACLQRAAREAQAARDLGPNIPPDKMAEYDRRGRLPQRRQSRRLSASARRTPPLARDSDEGPGRCAPPAAIADQASDDNHLGARRGGAKTRRKIV